MQIFELPNKRAFAHSQEAVALIRLGPIEDELDREFQFVPIGIYEPEILDSWNNTYFPSDIGIKIAHKLFTNDPPSCCAFSWGNQLAHELRRCCPSLCYLFRHKNLTGCRV